MELQVVDLHSFVPSLLTKGPVLDAGCKGFRFAEHFADLGHPIVMMDPAPDVQPPSRLYDLPNWCAFCRAALVGQPWPKSARLRMTADPEARHVTFDQHEGDPEIICLTIEKLMDETNITLWDLVKLNIEGAEYDVLAKWPGPIARQIVVSFHEHCHARGDAEVGRIVEHLSLWYVPVRHEKDARYGAGLNWWDSVFVLKDLA